MEPVDALYQGIKPFRFDVPDYVKCMRFPDITTRFVAILGHDHRYRGMVASPYQTRCVQQGEIHELIYVYQNKDGSIDLNHAWYLGFIEFKQGCVLAKGMTMDIAGGHTGTLIAFDMTHAPNHLNILIATDTPQTGVTAGLNIADQCMFRMPSLVQGTAQTS